MYTVKENDWKLFRKLLPEWQERFMGRLLGEYSTMIAGQGLATDRFWKLKERLQEDVRKTGVRAEMKRAADSPFSPLSQLFGGCSDIKLRRN